ncbi:MAG: hypothetical protein JJU34_16355 [Lunatimonas sp.]|uniref:hypothetical protein n=1 Tax=Lunatimonas sp. TaxID=2060141 RepID=UPI00263BA61D|nr:hypothetical protein [Lunatimonas sp.]MCC5938853.1 hypothetical protein [Lunatimonas sp.]
MTYYDNYYQPIQTISTHQLTGTVKTSSLYAFSGEVEKTVNTYTYTGNQLTAVADAAPTGCRILYTLLFLSSFKVEIPYLPFAMAY